MNSTDLLILQKVFPPQHKRLLVLLSSQNLPLHKAENYLSKLTVKTSQEREALPFNMDKFIEILQCDILLPNVSNGGFVYKPVFFSLSRRVQQNILLLLKTNYYSGCLNANLDGWKRFLKENAQLLDGWGKVLDTSIDKNSLNCTRIYLARSSVEKLKLLRHERFPLISSSLSKSYNFHESIIEIDSDGEDFMNLCEDESEQKEEIISSLSEAVIVKKESIEDNEEHSGNVNEIEMTIQSVKVESYVDKNITELKELCESPNINEFSKRFLEMISDYPSDKIGSICKDVNLVKINEEKLRSFLGYILIQDSLSLDSLHQILHHSLALRLIETREPVSRSLFVILSDTIKKCRHSVIVYVLHGIVCSCNFSNIHEDVFKKLIANGDMDTDDISELLETVFGTSDVILTSCHLSLFDSLLQRKPSMSMFCLVNMLNALLVYSVDNPKCLKLMKLLVSFVQNYSKTLFGYRKLLDKITDGNKTFLKKKVVQLLQNVPK